MPRGYKFPIIESGKRFGKWTVLNKVPGVGNRHSQYQCKCECGALSIIQAKDLIHGKSTQCNGCKMLSIRSKQNTLIKRYFSVGGFYSERDEVNK